MSKKLSTILIVIGVILVAVAILWWTVIGPMLVKLPDDIDTHMEFEGTLTLYVDQAPGASLAGGRRDDSADHCSTRLRLGT